MSHDGLIRRGFGLRGEVAPHLARDYHSDLVQQARNGQPLVWPGLEVRLAKEFGFCYGVERAVDYAYETRQKFPDRRLFITGEIIHNPRVNQRLRDLGYEFLDGAHGSRTSINDLRPDDVVLLPAFGVTLELLAQLRQVGVVLVDTTCSSVLNVWRSVESYAERGFTSLIHGQWDHEETRATASRAAHRPGSAHLIVRDSEEAEAVARQIERPGAADEFLARFARAASPGFDPTRHLERLGMANQTTMLSRESLAIGRRLREAIVRRYGEVEAADRFHSFATICSATQDRQDAVRQLLVGAPDLVIIIGGFNSSNTGHLAAICSGVRPTYHVEGADDLLDARRIRHKPVGAACPTVTENWLVAGPVAIGLTAGASTPDREIGRLIERLLVLRGLAGAE